MWNVEKNEKTLVYVECRKKNMKKHYFTCFSEFLKKAPHNED